MTKVSNNSNLPFAIRFKNSNAKLTKVGKKL